MGNSLLHHNSINLKNCDLLTTVHLQNQYRRFLFQTVFEVNVFGAALMTQMAVEIFKKQKSGNIINVASTAALKGFEQGTVYAASKFALRGMTQC